MRVFQALCVVLLCLSAARASQLATDVSLQTEAEFPSLSDLVDDCVNKVKSKFDSTVSSVQSTCTTSLNNAVNGLNSDISSIQSTALNAINSIPQNAISSLKKSVSDNVVTPINSALQRISDLDTNIKNKMAAAANDLTAVGNAIKKVAATIASFLGSPLLIDDPGTNCQVPPFITQINTYVKATVISTNAYCWFAGMAKKLKIESLTASLATVSIANKGTSLMEIDSTTGELVSSSAELQADDFNCDAATGVADQLEAISDVFCNVLATVDSNGDVTVQPKIAFVGACFRMSAGILKAICAAQGKY